MTGDKLNLRTVNGRRGHERKERTASFLSFPQRSCLLFSFTVKEREREGKEKRERKCKAKKGAYRKETSQRQETKNRDAEEMSEEGRQEERKLTQRGNREGLKDASTFSRIQSAGQSREPQHSRHRLQSLFLIRGSALFLLLWDVQHILHTTHLLVPVLYAN